MIHYIVGRNLGHLSRCVANVQRFQKISGQKVKVYAFKHSHSWLQSNLPHTVIRTFQNKKADQQGKKLLEANLILHDWRKEVETIKNLRGRKGPIIGGIYHSDLTITGLDSEWSKAFKKEVLEISNKTTDVFFHMNLTAPEKSPKLSSYYLPIPIISREITTSTKKVKQKLGISKDEPFILVHMGGGVGPFRYKYMDEWYEKIEKLRLPCRIVIAGQFGGVKRKFPKRFIQAPMFDNGRDLIHAADLVISKPGMGVLIDCITTNTPLLALPADSKEREVKNMMLRDMLGHNLCLASSQLSTTDLALQISEVLDHKEQIKSVFQRIPQNGAQIVAKCMKLLSRHSIKDLPDLFPQLQALSPFRV